MKLDDNIIKEVIRGYTKESGVRNLERDISKLARKVVKKIVAGEEREVQINNKNLKVNFEERIKNFKRNF